MKRGIAIRIGESPGVFGHIGHIGHRKENIPFDSLSLSIQSPLGSVSPDQNDQNDQKPIVASDLPDGYLVHLRPIPGAAPGTPITRVRRALKLILRDKTYRIRAHWAPTGAEAIPLLYDSECDGEPTTSHASTAPLPQDAPAVPTPTTTPPAPERGGEGG